MLCPNCGFDNPEGFRFCGSCGITLARLCPSCGSEVPAGFRFCGVCGTAMEEGTAGPTTQAVAPMPSERRQVTVLFADLVGFSTLAEHMDPEELRTLITGTFAELTEEVESREGLVEKFIGDAVVAIFGAPVTHEDDPDRAVEAALKMLEVVARRSEAAGQSLQLRIGINSGTVVSGTVGDGTQAGVMGDAVNTAARLQQAAGPGEILVSAGVWRRVRDRYGAQHVGELEVKGRDQLVDAYRILGPEAPSARRQAPFVGRREERALLDLLWSSVLKGNTHVVSLIGEPGVGKSRLLSEVVPKDGAVDIRVTCGGERAFGPFLDLLHEVIGEMPSDLDDLKRKTSRLEVEDETVMLLAALLGLAGAPPAVRMADEQQKRQVFAGVWQFLLTALGDRPGLLVFDDVHWADRSSLDLLGFLLERLGGVPLMLILAYRPGFDQVERTSLRASHTAVRLEPLTPDESVALARGFLGVASLPADLEHLVASRAEGNPFFVEELLQALLELGSLAVVEGLPVLARVEVDVPDTVQGTILARVDRLGAAERNLLQQAAVIGRHFTTDLLQEVMGGQDARPILEELARSQLLVAEGPDQWTFKHALIQEVTYDTLLLRQRRELHRRVAEVLEARAGDDPAFLEIVAEHYARAEVRDKARQYALAAGDLAAERMGFVEAQGRYETALRLWGEGDDPARVELLDRLGWVAVMAGDMGSARTTLLEAADGWERLGRHLQHGLALARLGRAYWISGDSEHGTETLSRAIAVLEPLGPSQELVRAFMVASTQEMLLGRSDQAVALARRGLDLGDAVGDAERSQLLNNIAVCESMRGDPQSVGHLREAMAMADRSKEAEARGRAYTNLPSTLGAFYLWRESAEISRSGRELMRQLGAPGMEFFIASNEAGALLELGRYEDAEALAGEMAEAQRALKLVPGLISSGAILAFIRVRKGRYEEARGVLDEIVPLARGLGGTEFATLAFGLEAEVERARGNVASARQAVQEAVRIAMDTPTISHVRDVLAVAARTLPREEVEPLLDRVRPVEDPSFRVAVLEAEGVLEGDPSKSAQAADLYQGFEMPYQEARCRLEAGQVERAEALIRRFGLDGGPLGSRLLQLREPGS